MLSTIRNLLRRELRSRRQQSHRVCVEPLEARTLLTGSVSAVIKGNSLVITGDAKHNDIRIVASGDEIQIRGTKTQVNGAAEVVLPWSSVISANVKVNLGDGNDRFRLFARVDGKLDIRMSSGDDRIDLNPAFGTGTEDTTKVKIDTGEGDDTVSIVGSRTLSVAIKTGAGDDKVTMDRGTTEGHLTIKTGSSSAEDRVSLLATDVSGTTRVVGGSGRQRVQVFGGDFNRASFSLGKGNDELELADDFADRFPTFKSFSANGGKGNSDLFDANERLLNSKGFELFG